MFAQSSLLLALAASATAHMIMLDPKPFNMATLTNGPLAVGDFPCKQRAGAYKIDEMNQWDAGKTKVVDFRGSAVHGGGSCQFSITTDPEPTEKSQWKVIQSVIGGCPSNVTGNLDGGPELEGKGGAATFPVTMPKDVPDGRYTFAWTWLNKVGNREFYMNCAPIQVGSASGSVSTASASAALGALPDMFIANLPATGCETKAYEDFAYPNPGKNVIQGENATPGSTLSGSACNTQTQMGAGSGQLGSPVAGTPSQGTPSQGTPSKASSIASQPQASQKPAYSAAPPSKGPVESKAPINPGGVFAPGASSIAVAGPTAQPTPPASKPSAPAVQPAPSAAPEQPSTPNTTTPTNGDCTPCTNDGGVVCIGSKQFGLCNRGCAVAQDLAAGMSCSSGAIVASTKRHLHFPRAHLHRRLSAARLV